MCETDLMAAAPPDGSRTKVGMKLKRVTLITRIILSASLTNQKAGERQQQQVEQQQPSPLFITRKLNPDKLFPEGCSLQTFGNSNVFFSAENKKFLWFFRPSFFFFFILLKYFSLFWFGLETVGSPVFSKVNFLSLVSIYLKQVMGFGLQRWSTDWLNQSFLRFCGPFGHGLQSREGPFSVEALTKSRLPITTLGPKGASGGAG